MTESGTSTLNPARAKTLPGTQLTPPIPFKVFGLQRSGTNLLVALILRNFHVHSLEIGAEWKHGPVQMPNRVWNRQLARFGLCVKNPYAWAVSCYRYFKRCRGTDRTMDPHFCDKPLKSFEEFLTAPSYDFQSPIHRWNQMNRLWLATLPADRTLLVRHEDQLTDQLRTLQAAQRKLGLRLLGKELSTINDKVDVRMSITGPMNRNYYQDRAYMVAYSPLLLETINQWIDRSLMSRLRYDIER